MNKKFSLLYVSSFIISSSYSMQKPAAKPLTMEERKARATSARRRCEIAYYSQCIQNDEKCAAAQKIHNDCWQVYQEALDKEMKEMIQESLNAQKN